MALPASETKISPLASYREVTCQKLNFRRQKHASDTNNALLDANRVLSAQGTSENGIPRETIQNREAILNCFSFVTLLKGGSLTF